MHASDSIVGLTLTELAFLIVLCVILFLVIGAGDRRRLEAEVTGLKQENDELTNARDILHAQLADLKAELEKRRAADKLRSAQPPSCRERGIARGFLLTIEIVGVNRYVLREQAETVTLQGLRERYASDLRAAATEQCVHSVDVYYDPAVSTTEYDGALRRLQEVFYTRLSGAARP